MFSRRGNPWLGVVNALFGGLAAVWSATVAAYLADLAYAQGSMIGLVALPVLILVLGALLSGFLLTILLPTASEWGAPAGWHLLWVLVAIVWMLKAPVAEWPTVFLAGVVATVLCHISYGGVLLARYAGPQRCRDRSRTVPSEPRCPACGYVLYYAKDQTCPDCGRQFALQEIDTRRALWEEGVLKPWEPAQPAADEPRSGDRI